MDCKLWRFDRLSIEQVQLTDIDEGRGKGLTCSSAGGLSNFEFYWEIKQERERERESKHKQRCCLATETLVRIAAADDENTTKRVRPNNLLGQALCFPAKVALISTPKATSRTKSVEQLRGRLQITACAPLSLFLFLKRSELYDSFFIIGIQKSHKRKQSIWLSYFSYLMFKLSLVSFGWNLLKQTISYACKVQWRKKLKLNTISFN